MTSYANFSSVAQTIVQSCLLGRLSQICEHSERAMRDILIEVVLHNNDEFADQLTESLVLNHRGDLNALAGTLPKDLRRFWSVEVKSRKFLIDALTDMFRDLPTLPASSDAGINPDDEPPSNPKETPKPVGVVPPLRTFKDMILHLEHHRRGMICDGGLILACQLVPVQVDVVGRYMKLPASVKEKCTLAEWDSEVSEAVRLGSV